MHGSYLEYSFWHLCVCRWYSNKWNDSYHWNIEQFYDQLLFQSTVQEKQSLNIEYDKVLLDITDKKCIFQN